MSFPYTLIDLTHTLEKTTPSWDETSGFACEIACDYDACQGEDTFRIMNLHMPAGIGTHMDAESHAIPGGKNIDDYDVEQLCMECIVIDVSEKSHERFRLQPDDILTFEKKYGPIPKHSCVMIHTGWSRLWNDPKKYHNNLVFPSVSTEAVALFLEREINALGIDTLSPDRPEDGFPVHRAFLGQGKLIIENVAHLDKMPPIGAFIMALPLKIKGATEAPLRLLGLVEKEKK